MMTKKDICSYKVVFKFLRNKGIVPTKVMADFETAIRNQWSISVQKPKCWDVGSTSAKQLDADLNEEQICAKRLIGMFQQLPRDHIENGLMEIMELQKRYHLHVALKDFNTYFKNFWMRQVTTDVFCVSNVEARTKNYVESLFAKMKKNIPTKPNIYCLLQNLISLVNETHMKFLYEKGNGVRIIDHSFLEPELFRTAFSSRLIRCEQLTL
ncbi:CLUMA_CG007970, isoform A [Clunio marinus]|uniref:CLUMA_CG007970, isoform A n=1 Tax=Clunio marinus TaxID=568069 RepID=A0A1J1I297_9DIPT|nr:CLUMA_CG007970, isoform A [Clunio marinus]